MRSLFTRYLNEIVSLTIMALLCVALVAGQAEAALQVSGQQGASAETNDEPVLPHFIEDSLRLVDKPELEIDITFRFRQTGE